MRELEGTLAELRERAGTRDRDLDLLVVRDRGDRGARPERGGEGSRSWPSARACASSTGCSRPRGPGRRRSRRAVTIPGWPRCSRGPRASPRPSPGADAELDALAERLAALRLEAEDLGAELRRYADSLEAEPGQARRGRGAARALRPARAQARRQRGRGARARGALPRGARAPRARGGGDRAGRGRARGGACGARQSGAAGWAPLAGRPRRSSPSGCSRSSPRWRWRARRSRWCSSRARRSGRAAPSASS